MPERIFPVGVLARRRTLDNPWVSHSWAPSGVLASAPAAAPWTPLGRDGDADIFYAGAYDLSLHSGETSHYRDNLVSGRPSLWVALRRTGGDELDIACVTADPYEGEALVEDVGLIVEAVPMPPEIEGEVAAFFEAHHVEREFFKRKRKRSDPEGIVRRAPRVLGLDEEGEP